MKKLLLGTAAVALGLSLAAPAKAESAFKLDVGGHYKGYLVWIDQDDNDSAADERTIDILNEKELHFSGEATLDNGLTVGAHYEIDLDSNDVDGDGTNEDAVDQDEAYVYFSGSWGRVNFGQEDGSAYLMQVSAPSADSNVDGLRQYIQPINYDILTDGAITGDRKVDYDQGATGKSNKVTYMTPVFSGFQAGISYTPEVGGASRGVDGVNKDDEQGELGSGIDAAVRWEGQLSEVGVAVGAGYTSIEEEDDLPTPTAGQITDDRDAWNVGLDLNWGAFGAGVSYGEDNNGDVIQTDNTGTVGDEEKLVVGVDYTTGPYKLGLSYLDVDNAFAENNLELTRFTGGVVYTYGPGMTFRGSVQYTELDNMNEADGLNAGISGGDDADSTALLLGTQINF